MAAASEVIKALSPQPAIPHWLCRVSHCARNWKPTMVGSLGIVSANELSYCGRLMSGIIGVRLIGSRYAVQLLGW